MTKELYIKKIDKIKNLINANRIADAIDQLIKLGSGSGDFKSTDDLNQLKQTYTYMIQYMLQGLEDNTRRELLSSIKEDLYSIADDMLISELSLESPGVYYSTIRTVVLQKLSLRTLLMQLEDIENQISLLYAADDQEKINSLQKTKFLIYRQIFDTVLASRKNSDINSTILDWINAHPQQHSFSLYLISAITISLLKYYDKRKMHLLIDLYASNVSEAVSAYALCALLLSLNLNLKRVDNDIELIKRLEKLKNSESIISDLTKVIKSLMQTSETERAYIKMRDEVIPELMKIKPDIMKKLGGIEMDESSSFEANPEWADILEENGISDKLKEISEMHAEGADLMMISFSNLKNFHFFQSMESWFLPFDIRHPALSVSESKREIYNKILGDKIEIVSSDKYSLVLALNSMPKEQTEMMMSQLEMQMSQMKDLLAERGISQNENNFDGYLKIFVKLLYRFYKLYNRKNEFTDPFKSILQYDKFPVISQLLSSSDVKILSAEYYFKTKYFENALYWFKALESELCEDATYWEKLGFCYQKVRDYNAAFEAYKRSAILKDPNAWLLKRLAFVALQSGNLREAVQYYASALELDPENVDLLYKAGNVYTSLNNFEDALKCFYHANYLNQDDVKLWRAIAWCETLKSNFKKADSYYTKLNSIQTNFNDLLNAGHVKLLSGLPSDAYELYKRSFDLNRDQFEKDFVADYPLLIKLGVDSITLDLMLDSLKMK